MKIKVDRRSKAYNRIVNAGFKIRNISLYKIKEIYFPEIIFTCICGTKEMFFNLAYIKENIPKRLDVARMIEESGAISENHLKLDGYSQAQIDYIRRVYS